MTITHLKAWEEEHRRGIWKGPYALDFFRAYTPPSGLVLDAGCGIGRYTIPLALNNYCLIGIDISSTAINTLHDEVRRRHLKIGLAAADIRNLPFDGGVFDIVTCFGVLQHLLENERQMALAEFDRVLVQRGLLIIEVLGREDMRSGGIPVEPFTYLRSTGSVYHYFNVEELTELLSDFKIIDIREEKHVKHMGGKEYKRHMISVAAMS